MQRPTKPKATAKYNGIVIRARNNWARYPIFSGSFEKLRRK